MEMELNAFRLRGETTAGDVWADGAMSSEGEGTELEDEQLLPCGGGESLCLFSSLQRRKQSSWGSAASSFQISDGFIFGGEAAY